MRLRFRLPIHPYLRPSQVELDLGGAARRDPLGHRLHLLFGLFFCFFASWPTSFVEIAGAPLVVFFLIRTPNIWRTWGSFAVQPLVVMLAAWIGWQALSLTWTPDPKQGLHEFSANRWIWVMWMLWPIMEARMWLIAALVAGFLCGNLAQLGHDVGRHFGIHWLVWPRLPDRNSGWWDPVVGGSLLVAALGLHLPAALMGRGRWRWIGLGGVVVTLLAIGATGTRGAWVGAALLCEVAISYSVFRVRGWGRRAARLGVVLAATGALIGAVYLLKGDAILRRLDQARQDVARALDPDQPDFRTHTGARVMMAWLALEAFKSGPVRGIGAGGYRMWCHTFMQRRGWDPGDADIRQHCHSAPLQIAATTGLVGLLLAGLAAAVALRGGMTDLGPEEEGRNSGVGSYAAGPAFGLLGLLLAGLFDPVELNAQTAAMMATLMGLCLVSRPGGLTTEPWRTRSGDQRDVRQKREA